MSNRHLVGIVAGASSEIGGVERHILSLVKHTDPRRFGFVVFSPQPLALAVQDLALESAEGVGWGPRSPWSLGATVCLCRLLRGRGVGLLHIHDPRSGVLGRLVARVLGLPVVYTVHLPPYYYTAGVKRWAYRYMERLLSRWFTDRIIYVSHRVCQEAIGLRVAPQDRSTVIENGIDLRPYNQVVDRKTVREALGTPEDSTVFCFVGRFTEQKGVDVLLRAVARLRDQHTAFRVWLVGDGPLRAQLEQHALKEGLASYVQFLGFRDDVPTLLGASDVFVLPSRYEALPLSVLEAMAAGLPCIVTDVGDNAELVEDGITGIVVPPENSDALAAALERLLADPEIRSRIGESARRKAQQYSIERVAARIMEVYDDILTRPPQASRIASTRG